jgi:hypothetical protein
MDDCGQFGVNQSSDMAQTAFRKGADALTTRGAPGGDGVRAPTLSSPCTALSVAD